MKHDTWTHISLGKARHMAMHNFKEGEEVQSYQVAWE